MLQNVCNIWGPMCIKQPGADDFVRWKWHLCCLQIETVVFVNQKSQGRDHGPYSLQGPLQGCYRVGPCDPQIVQHSFSSILVVHGKKEPCENSAYCGNIAIHPWKPLPWWCFGVNASLANSRRRAVTFLFETEHCRVISKIMVRASEFMMTFYIFPRAF